MHSTIRYQVDIENNDYINDLSFGGEDDGDYAIQVGENINSSVATTIIRTKVIKVFNKLIGRVLSYRYAAKKEFTKL